MSLSFSQPWTLLGLSLLPLVVWGGAVRLRGRGLAWAVLSLRCMAVAALVLALAQPVLQLSSRAAGVVFLIDGSDSVSPSDRQAAVEFVRAAQAAAPAGTLTGVVVFGAEPRVEQEPAAGAALGNIETRVDGSATDIAAAVRLGVALFPAGTARRLVLLSDGRSTSSTIEAAVRAVAQAGAPVEVRPIGSARASDAVVESLDAPARVRQGQAFELTASVRSAQSMSAALQILGDGQLIAERQVQLDPGPNQFTVAVPAQPRGFRRWQARLVSNLDTEPRNNRADAFTEVESPPRVLIAEGRTDEGAPIEAALKATGLESVRLPAVQLPRTPSALSEYAAVVLVNVPLAALPDKGDGLRVYVHDLGRGLITVGGDSAYALGAYFDSPLEQALPVESRLRNRKDEPAVALVMAIDKSGSMAVCHCAQGGGPDPPGSTPKVDVAKEAAIRSAAALGPDDEFGVVAFDTAARWVVHTAPLVDKAAAESSVADIQGSGGTNIYGGLAEAIDSLKQSRAAVKHVVLLTDGWSNVGNYDALLAEARAAGITVSTVSAGGGSPELLASIASKAGGVFYQPRSSSEIPEILVRETQSRLRRYVQEETFTPAAAAPSTILKDITTVPPLLGYINTSAKPSATVALLSPSRDPVLAQWQYGLGRSVAWTADAGGRWTREWMGTPQFRRLFSQAVDWARGRPSSNVEAAVHVENGRVRLEVDARTPTGSYLNGAAGSAQVFGPDGGTASAALEQTAPGRYSAELPAGQPGSYVASVSLSTPRERLQTPPVGFGIGYSAEYRESGPDFGALALIAAQTGGAEVKSPADVFRRPVPAGTTSHHLWRPLLLTALLLLPIEVALRRARSLPSPRSLFSAPAQAAGGLHRRRATRVATEHLAASKPTDPRAERLRAAKARASAPYVPGSPGDDPPTP